MTALDGIFLARPEAFANGISLAVKDLLDTEGLTTTYGSTIFAEHVPAKSAEAVLRLETAGYVTIGKTNLHEFAYGTTSENPHYGTVPNPRAAGRIAGGSSGGSAAALAAGLADAALGTDSGGSIRIPSACCGVVGFKPTYNLVPIGGCFPLAPSFDHVGPMARDVARCEAILAALVPEFESKKVEALEEVVIGTAWLDEADPLVRARVEQAAALFPRRHTLDLPRPNIDALFMREVASVHSGLYDEHRELYGEDVALKIERCLEVSDGEVNAAERARAEYAELSEELVEEVDLLLTPTIPTVAPAVGLGDLKLRRTLTRNTLPFNSLGWPALALPCGLAENGLFASVQVAGRHGADSLVIATAACLARHPSFEGQPAQ